MRGRLEVSLEALLAGLRFAFKVAFMKISLTRTFAAGATGFRRAYCIRPWPVEPACGKSPSPQASTIASDTPVRVALEVPADLRSAKSAVLQGSDDAIPCQITAAGLQAGARRCYNARIALRPAVTQGRHFDDAAADRRRPTMRNRPNRQRAASKLSWADGKPGETEIMFAGRPCSVTSIRRSTRPTPRA